MVQDWTDVRADALVSGRLDKARIEEQTREILTQVRAHRLAEIREASGLSQTDVASRLGMSPSRASRLERGDMDHAELATVRAYVGALGGEMEIVTKFGDGPFTIG